MIASVKMQCTTPCGTVGTYLADDAGLPVSPVCRDFYELCEWIRYHDWKMVPGTFAGKYEGEPEPEYANVKPHNLHCELRK